MAGGRGERLRERWREGASEGETERERERGGDETKKSRRDEEGGGRGGRGARERRRRWKKRRKRGPGVGWRGGEAREKDIKVRNSQRGERAPPRHRLDRGSLVPLLGCSPPLLLLLLDPPTYSPPAPYPPVHRPQPIPSSSTHERSPRPPNHPPASAHSVELESPRVRALHTHSCAYVSSCPAVASASALCLCRRLRLLLLLLLLLPLLRLLPPLCVPPSRKRERSGKGSGGERERERKGRMNTGHHGERANQTR